MAANAIRPVYSGERPQILWVSAPLQVVWLEQEDARLISQGEEVTLMDWGNAIVEVCPRTVVLLKTSVHLREAVLHHTHAVK